MTKDDLLQLVNGDTVRQFLRIDGTNLNAEAIKALINAWSKGSSNICKTIHFSTCDFMDNFKNFNEVLENDKTSRLVSKKDNMILLRRRDGSELTAAIKSHCNFGECLVIVVS
uniref:BACK domain-containing protein n=1 Tax=Rhabditophanes sp. KR3021 TaxID=114890 RepID=A0AC35UGA0_9BILA